MKKVPIQDRIDALPESIRTHIKGLENDLARYKEMIDEMNSGDTNVCWYEHFDQEPVSLPNNATVEMKIDGGVICMGIRYERPGEVIVFSKYPSLAIVPMASNSVSISLTRK